MSRWVRLPKGATFVLACWAVAAPAVALWDLRAAIVVCLGGVFCFLVAIALAERRWWIATGASAFGGATVLILVTAGAHSRVEHNVVFSLSLAALTYWAAAFAADRRTRSRRG
jgi:hypothetical protein